MVELCLVAAGRLTAGLDAAQRSFGSTFLVGSTHEHLRFLPLPDRFGIWIFRVARAAIVKAAPPATDADSRLGFESDPDLDVDSSPESIRQRIAPRVRAALLSLPLPAVDT